MKASLREREKLFQALAYILLKLGKFAFFWPLHVYIYELISVQKTGSSIFSQKYVFFLFSFETVRTKTLDNQTKK